jgi:SET family sugar efflux transporter-like MFS transporter
MLYFGVVASRGDQTRVIRLSALIAVIYYSLLLLVRSPWHVYPLQILSAAMVAVNSGVAITFFQNYLPGQPGTATNLFITAARIGSTAGYFLFGSLAAMMGYRGVFGVCALLSVTTLLLFIYQHRRMRFAAGTAQLADHRTA